MSLTDRFFKSRSGNVGMIFALTAIPMFGVTGAALDYSRGNSERSRLQSAVDAIALAAVLKPATEQDATALAFAAAYPFSEMYSEAPRFTVTTRGSPITVQAETKLKTSILRIIGVEDIYIKASATAVRGPETPACLTLLDPTKSGAFEGTGSNVLAPKCEAHVQSTSSSALEMGGNTAFSFRKLCIKGRAEYSLSNTYVDAGSVQEGCNANDDPLKNSVPTSTSGPCKIQSENNSGVVYLDPGTYCGDYTFSGSSKIVLRPGVFHLKNSTFNFIGGSGEIEGDGVSFYLEGNTSTISISGTNISLTAPKTGALAGYLVAQDSSSAKRTLTITGSGLNKLEGIVYVPSQDIVYAGNNMGTASASYSHKLTIVARSLLESGNNWRLAPYIDNQGTTSSARLIN